jgi:hypothetical protein
MGSIKQIKIGSTGQVLDIDPKQNNDVKSFRERIEYLETELQRLREEFDSYNQTDPSGNNSSY